MGAQSDRLRCEVCQNLILSPINTGFLRYAVATVLTVYGIETSYDVSLCNQWWSLQQCLPFTVLKPNHICNIWLSFRKLQQCLPFTVLKLAKTFCHASLCVLQQCLPFTVLKHFCPLGF